MKKFKIYAGVIGRFGGASYQCTIEAKNTQDAIRFAYQLAEEEYQSYEGSHGIMSWEDCEEELRNLGIIGNDMSQNEIEDMVDSYYLSQIESQTEYSAIEIIDER